MRWMQGRFCETQFLGKTKLTAHMVHIFLQTYFETVGAVVSFVLFVAAKMRSQSLESACTPKKSHFGCSSQSASTRQICNLKTSSRSNRCCIGNRRRFTTIRAICDLRCVKRLAATVLAHSACMKLCCAAIIVAIRRNMLSLSEKE